MKHTKIDFSQFTNDQLDTIYEKTVGYKPIAEDGQTREQAIELITSYNDEYGVTIPSQIENSPQGQKAIIQAQQSQYTPMEQQLKDADRNSRQLEEIVNESLKDASYWKQQARQAQALNAEMLNLLELSEQVERTMTLIVNGANVSYQGLEMCRNWFAEAKSLLSRARQ